MLLVVTTQAQLGFQRNGLGKAALDTFIDGIARGIYEIIEELEYENVTGIGDGEILFEHAEKAFVLALVGRGFELEKIFERLDLDAEQIGCFCQEFNFTEIDTLGSVCF
jgi:hypothetical protein